jgi:hypothetical protein
MISLRELVGRIAFVVLASCCLVSWTGSLAQASPEAHSLNDTWTQDETIIDSKGQPERIVSATFRGSTRGEASLWVTVTYLQGVPSPRKSPYLFVGAYQLVDGVVKLSFSEGTSVLTKSNSHSAHLYYLKPTSDFFPPHELPELARQLKVTRAGKSLEMEMTAGASGIASRILDAPGRSLKLTLQPKP